MKKLSMFLIVLIIGSTLFAGGSTEEEFIKPDYFDWRNYEGTTINYYALNYYYKTQIEQWLDEFYDLTGITVNIVSLPEDQLYEKLAIELASGSTSVDVFNTSGICNDGWRYSENGYYFDLNEFVDDPVMTSSDWDPDDFIASVYDSQIIDGKRVAIPCNAVTWVLYYRKDLLENAGLEVPLTMDELIESARILNKDGVYGFGGRGKKTQAAQAWSNFLFNYGGSWIENGKSNFANEAGYAALQTYVTLMRDYSNPGSSNNDWTDIQAMFAQGQIAFMIDSNAWNGVFLDPNTSTVYDKFGVAAVPTVEESSPVSVLWSWNLAISSSSENKGAAWYFIQWATSKEIQQRIQENNFVTARHSAWNSEKYIENVNQDWYEATQVSLERAVPMLWAPSTHSAEINDIVGTAIIDAINGADIKTALNKAAADVDSLL